MVEQIIFSFLAIVIALCSVLAVTSKRIVHSAIFLLSVLLATAALFLMLNYHFLFAVQTTVYAGGIMIMFIMAIFLTHKPGKIIEYKTNWRIISSLLLSISGFLLCGYIILGNITRIYNYVKLHEIKMHDIGHAMMGTGKYQFLLPFEVISLLLLACIIGAIMIARKEKNVEMIENKEIKK